MATKRIQISGQVTNEKIENPKLTEAIDEMKSNFNQDTQNKVINMALRATFLVPTIIEQNQELVADENNHVSFQDKQTAKFLLVNKPARDKDGNETGTISYFPVFTDMDELHKLNTDQHYRAFAMKFSDIANLTENTPNVDGFVLNPFNKGHNLPFTKPMLASIKQTLIKYKQDKEAAAKAAAENGESEGAAPDITVSSSDEQN